MSSSAKILDICSTVKILGMCVKNCKRQYRAVGISSGYGLDDRGVRVLVLVGSTAFRPALKPTQLPIERVPEG
jgi:hypothetical protein